MAVINFFDNPLASSKKKIIKKESSVRDVVNKYLEKKDHAQKYEVYNPKTGKTSYKVVETDAYKVATVVNGKEEGLDYIIKKNDVVDIIFSPRGNTTAMDWTSFIAGSIMAIAGTLMCVFSWGTLAGPGLSMAIGGTLTVIGSIVSMATRKGPEEAQRQDTSQLEKNKALTIKGAENQLITGQRFPFIFGKYAVNPYIIGSPFHETFAATSGKFESQYMTCLYCLGYGPLKLTDFKIGETILTYNRPRALYDEAKTFNAEIAANNGYFVYDAVTDSYSEADPQPTSENFGDGTYFTYNDEEANNPTFMHGRINPHTLSTSFNQTVANRGEYYTYNANKRSYDKADPQPTADTWRPDYYYELNTLVPKKWKNNDVQIEILQRGLKETDIPDDSKFGTLYNQTVCEDEVGASVIFIHDNDISEAAEKQYKGVAVPKGYRTNTVRLSQNCPIKIEVELDFQNGLYRSRPEKQSNTSALRLYDIPVRFAVQWRPVKKGNQVSNAESGEGWRSFDYLMLGETRASWQTPKPYLPRHGCIDMSLNAGASKDGNRNMFYTDLARYANDIIYPNRYNEIYGSCYQDVDNTYGIYGPYGRDVYGNPKYSPSALGNMASNNASSQAREYTNSWVDTNDYNKIMQAMDAGYITRAGFNEDWVGTDVFCINENKNYGTAYGPKSFDGNERIYPFVKEFTKEEVDEILATGSDYVEVRVIRLTPCYIDQSGTDNENYGDFSYEDLCQWSTMRTTCFDKDAYTEALKTNSAADPHNFPLRPIRESDLKKFTYVAVRLKQDVTEVGGSTFRKLRILAESFSPKYDVENKVWHPENVSARFGYYQKVQTADGWQIIELTESDYFDKVANKEPHLFKKRKGNDFTQQVANDIFREESLIGESPYPAYKLLPEVEERYVDNNTACSTLLGMLGQHNGEEAKCYDDINMSSAAELYKFCSDVTDGQTDKDGNLLHIKYSCNGIITEEKKLEDIVKAFLLTGRSIIRRDDENRYEFFIGRKVNYPVAVLNSKNVLTKSNTRTFQEVPSGLQLTYPSEDDDYTNNPLYVMDKGEDWKNPSKPMEQFSLPYVTNRDQIRSLALYNLAARLYQRETYTWTVGKIGLTFSIGDMVLLQDDSILTGTDHGGRIMEILRQDNVVYGFITDEPYEYTGELENGQSVQGVTIVQPNKYGPSRCVTLRMATPAGNALITPDKMTIGLTRIVALAHPITITEDGNFSDESLVENGEFCTLDPKEGDLVSFGIMTKITRKAQIMSIKPSQNKFSLSMVPYNDDFFNYGRELPQFNPSLTIQNRVEEDVEFSPYATKMDVAESKANADDNKKNLSVDLSAETTITTCKATRDGIILISETYTSGLNRERLTPISVTWTFAREVVWSEYFVADPQPLSQEEIDTEEYYYKDENDNYYIAETFDPNETYYTAVAHIENVPIMQITSNEETFSFTFDRGQPVSKLGGYPEAEDFATIKIQASAKLTVSTKTIDSFFTRVDTSEYGTWIPQKPLIEQSVQDRTVSLSFSQPSGEKRLYGTESLVYRVRVKRLEDGISEQFGKTNLTDSPYPEYNGELVSKGNEFNYKVLVKANVPPTTQAEALLYFVKDANGDFVRATALDENLEYYTEDTGYTETGRTYTQTMPLKGQKNKAAESTNYQFEVCAVNVKGDVTETNTIVVAALVTNLRDIVNANATEKELYVPQLSAITANLGEITDGSLKGNATNYWTLSDKPNPTPSANNEDFQGAFRVGGTNSYIQVTPILDPNTHQVVEYKTDISTDSVRIAGQSIEFHNNTFLYDENDFTNHGHEGMAPYYKKRLHLTHAGMFMEVYDEQSGLWGEVGKVSLSDTQTIVITNEDDPDEVPPLAVKVPGAKVHHLKNNFLNEEGTSTIGVTFSGTFFSDVDNVSLFGDSILLNGEVQQTPNASGQLVGEVSVSGCMIRDGFFTTDADFVTLDTNIGNVSEYNSVLSNSDAAGNMSFVMVEES